MPSRRVRQHVNPLRSEFFRIALPDAPYPEDRPLEVELGSAEGVWLFERAVEDASRFHLGVEIRELIVDKANAEARRRGLYGTHVRTVFANMSVDLPRLFPAGRVSRFFLNFPDPWWKSKQQKRRVAEEGLVDEIHRALAPGGEIYVNTDIFDIALESLFLFECESPERFENVAGAWSFLKKSPFGAMSRREQQCRGDGSPVWRIGFRKISLS